MLPVFYVPSILANLQLIRLLPLNHVCLPVLILLLHIEQSISVLTRIRHRIGQLPLGERAKQIVRVKLVNLQKSRNGPQLILLAQRCFFLSRPILFQELL